MASKQLGKLRQWGREVISTKEKTVLKEEFKEVETDIELRRAGIQRLHSASHEYHGYLHKKKEYTSVEEGVKMLPIDALGAVMMAHGEEFGHDSAFGQCLVKLGRAHCKIATLQETFALTFKDTYMNSLAENLLEIEDYHALRKKLDSRRLTLDAAVAKASKVKKEKETKEAEEEVALAKERYEEVSAEVRTRMRNIQDNEIKQLRNLTELLTIEADFVTQHLEILHSTRDEWLDESSVYRPESTPSIPTPHEFAHSGRTTPSISSTARATPSRPSSSAGSTGRKSLETVIDRQPSTKTPVAPPRPSSRGSSGPGPVPPPRPSSRGSIGTETHKRRDSASSELGSNNKRVGVAGWASTAVSSFSLSSSKKDKDKDKSASRAFANLENASDEEDNGALQTEPRTRSFSSFGIGSSALSKIIGGSSSSATSASRASSQTNTNAFSSSNSSFNSFSFGGSKTGSGRRVMRALYDYDGSKSSDRDQLSFKAGDEISVIYEGRDGWYMGEHSISGERGLFPASYTEDVNTPTGAGPSSTSRPPPLLPQRHSSTIAKRAQEAALEDDASILSEDIYSPTTTVPITPGLYNPPKHHPHLELDVKSPIDTSHSRDTTSITSESLTDDENEALFDPPDTPALFGSPVHPTTSNGMEIGNRAGNPIAATPIKAPPALPQRRQSTKRAPPPPPPPPPMRRMNSVAASVSSMSTSSSTSGDGSANIPLVGAVSVSFPPPPSVPKRPSSRGSRSRSSTVVPVPAVQVVENVSPFDN